MRLDQKIDPTETELSSHPSGRSERRQHHLADPGDGAETQPPGPQPLTLDFGAILRSPRARSTFASTATTPPAIARRCSRSITRQSSTTPLRTRRMFIRCSGRADTCPEPLAPRSCFASGRRDGRPLLLVAGNESCRAPLGPRTLQTPAPPGALGSAARYELRRWRGYPRFIQRAMAKKDQDARDVSDAWDLQACAASAHRGAGLTALGAPSVMRLRRRRRPWTPDDPDHHGPSGPRSP